jgi:hypothetical protein
MKKQSTIRKLMVLLVAALMCVAMTPSIAFADTTDTTTDTSASTTDTTASDTDTAATSSETIDFNVSIEWVDYNVYGRPESVTAVVSRTTANMDDYEYVTSRDLVQDGDGNFPTITFTDMPLYDENGDQYKYYVEQKDVPDSYTCATSGDQDVGFVMVNTFMLSPKEVTVTKNWVGEPTDSAEVTLYANGEEYETVTLTAADNWTYTWYELPALTDDGVEISYTVDEANVPEGYSKSVEGSGGNFKITNTELTDVSVQKVWNDGEGENRPDSVSVQLYANGVATGDKIILTSDNAWEYTWDDLAKCDSDGNEIDYTVEEDSVDGYRTEVEETSTNDFTITNTAQTSVSVKKVWNDNDSATRPDSVQVQLYANGEATGDKITLNADNDWSYTWSDLDKYDEDAAEITYAVQEDSVSGYITAITSDGAGSFTITNTKTTSIPDTNTKKISIPVTKKWVGDAGESATVHLFANGTEVGSATLTADDNWTYIFEDLAQADSNGNEITYTLTEDAIDGYESSITGDAENGFVVTNTYISPNSDGDSDGSGNVNRNDGSVVQSPSSGTNAKNSSGPAGSSSVSGKSSVSVVRTGDTSNVILWTVTLTVSAAAIAIGLFLRKRLSKKN